MQETWVPSLGQEDKNPMDGGAWQATVHGGFKRVRHDLGTKHQQQFQGYSKVIQLFR